MSGQGREWYKSYISIKDNDMILIGIMYTNEIWDTSKGSRYLDWTKWINKDYTECPVNTKKHGKRTAEVIAMKEVYHDSKQFNCNQFTYVVIHAPKSYMPWSVYQKSKKYLKTQECIALKTNYVGSWPDYKLLGCRVQEVPGETASWVSVIRMNNEWFDIYPHKKINKKIKEPVKELYEWVTSKIEPSI